MYHLAKAQCYKTFNVCNFNELEFVTGKPFKPGLMFVGKSRFYLCEAPFRSSTLGQAPRLTHKHQTRMEEPARNKHSSLLHTWANYSCKKGPRGHNYKSVQIHNLRKMNIFCVKLGSFLVSAVFLAWTKTHQLTTELNIMDIQKGTLQL